MTQTVQEARPEQVAAPEGGAVDAGRDEAGRPASPTVAAARRRWVSIHTLAEEFCQSAKSPEPGRKQRFQEHLGQFEAEHGSIVDFYFSDRIAAACVYTEGRQSGQERLFLTFPSQCDAPTWTAEVLYKGLGLHSEVCQVLDSSDRRICLEMLFVLLAQVVRIMEASHPLHHAADSPLAARATSRERTGNAEAAHAASNGIDPDVPAAPPAATSHAPLAALYHDQLAAARRFYERSAQRAAQTRYFLGMLAGFALLVLLALGAEPVLTFLSQSALGPDLPMLRGCFLIGAVGAVVSVMHRMTDGSLVLKHRAGRHILVLLGSFRPIIGAVFAVLVYLLVVANLVPLAVQGESEHPLRSTYFFGILAFFAGFSERWVQDMLAAGQRHLTVNYSASPEE